MIKEDKMKSDRDCPQGVCPKCGFNGYLHQKGRDFPDFVIGVIQCPSCCFILDLFYDKKERYR